MYSPALTHWHLTKSVNEYTWSTHYEFNNAPIYSSGFDWWQYNEDNWVGLHFDYRPLSYYLSIGKIQVWIS
jgi:hypothetical protein